MAKIVSGTINYTPRTTPYPKSVKVDAAAWGIPADAARAYDAQDPIRHSQWSKFTPSVSPQTSIQNQPPARSRTRRLSLRFQDPYLDPNNCRVDGMGNGSLCGRYMEMRSGQYGLMLPEVGRDGTYTIGRNERSDIILEPGSSSMMIIDPRHQMISAQHLELAAAGGDTHLTQLGFYPTSIRMRPGSGRPEAEQWRPLFAGMSVFLAKGTYELLLWQWTHPLELKVPSYNESKQPDPFFNKKTMPPQVIGALVDIAAAGKIVHRGDDAAPLFVSDRAADFFGEAASAKMIAAATSPANDNLTAVAERVRDLMQAHRSGDVDGEYLPQVRSAVEELTADPAWPPYLGLKEFGLVG